MRTQVPVNDPLLLVPAMAAATEHLGFGVTVTLSYEPPFPFARRMSTLDHLTDGRIGWNIVTGYLDSAAKGMGEKGQRAHDDRYAVAEDYMQVVYKLWEGSWRDDAVRADKSTGVFTDPSGRAPRRARRPALPARRHSPQRTLAAAHARPLPGRHLAGGPRLCRPPRRMRVHVGSIEAGDRAARRGGAQGGGRGGSGREPMCSSSR